MSDRTMYRPPAALGLAALVAAVALLALWLVAADALIEIDRQLYLAIRGTAAAGPPLLTEIVRDVTALGSNTLAALVTGVAVVCLFLGGWRREAAFVVLTVASGAVVVALLKELFARPRPDLFEHAHQVFTLSFPSGHASKSALVYLTLAVVTVGIVRVKSIRVFIIATALLLMLAIGLSRVYLGVHWPGDVLAGWLLGSLWVLGARAVERRLAAGGP